MAVSNPNNSSINRSILNHYYRMKETLEEFLDRNGLSQIENFSNEFPDSINISQAIGAWKCIVSYQHRVKQV